MSLTRDADHNADTANLVAVNLRHLGPDGRTVLDRMRDAQAGQPGAARWDGGGRSADVWCFEHESDHRGEPPCPHLEPVAERSDPTGTAALGHDQAAADLRALNRHASAVRPHLEAMVRIMANYQWRPPTELERARTTNLNDPHCESCIRIDVAKGVPWWVEPLTLERSTVGDRLTKALWLCRWCYDHAVERGCLPNEDELEQHRAGRRIRCPHPRVEQEAS